jgi:hypothetical protein
MEPGFDRSLPGERRAVADRRAAGDRGTGGGRRDGEPVSQAAPADRATAAPGQRGSNGPAGAPDGGHHSPPGGSPGAPRGGPDGGFGFGQGAACTAPQLRRFIKSRPYVPMHELRRRFAINGTEDDVTGIDLGSGRVYVGLPGREGALLGELLRGGDIGYELSMDPRTPVVIGLYPMRPVARG